MIELFFWPTPNGMKPLIFLREIGLEYRLTPVNINSGQQFEPEFLDISPNARIPAILDHDPEDGGSALSIFESGAILIYLAHKTRAFLPEPAREQMNVLQWLMWQMGALGPMLGQNHHFNVYAPEKVPYAIQRYDKEASRLYAVLDRQLEDREFICIDYSIADIACYPWINRYERHRIDLALFPNVERWYRAIGKRPAVIEAYAEAAQVNDGIAVDRNASASILFGQTADTMRRAVSEN